jgi:hypothetical protein
MQGGGRPSAPGSAAPVFSWVGSNENRLVPPAGFEPATHGLGNRCPPRSEGMRWPGMTVRRPTSSEKRYQIGPNALPRWSEGSLGPAGSGFCPSPTPAGLGQMVGQTPAPGIGPARTRGSGALSGPVGGGSRVGRAVGTWWSRPRRLVWGLGGLGQPLLLHPLSGEGVDQAGQAQHVDLLAGPSRCCAPGGGGTGCPRSIG